MSDGYQAVSLALRAPRVAVLFDADGDWVSWAAQALGLIGQYWGGAGFILVPYGASGVSESMLATSAAYDPDYVVLAERSIGDMEAVQPGTVNLVAEDGSTISGQDRPERIAQVADALYPCNSGFRARSQVVQACNSYRQLMGQLTTRSEDIDERIQSIASRRDKVSPLTHISQIVGDPAAFGLGQESYSDPLWTLAVAAKVGFHDAPNLPLQSNGVTPADRWLYRHALESDSLPPDSLRVGPGAKSVWDRTIDGLVWTARPGYRASHLVVMGKTAEDYCQAFAWHRMYGTATWLPFDEMPQSDSPEFGAVWSFGQTIRSDAMYPRNAALFVSWSTEKSKLETTRSQLVDAAYLIEEGEDAPYESDRGRVADLVRVVHPDDLTWPMGRTLSIRHSYDHTLTLPASFDDDGTVRLLEDLPRLEPSAVELDQLRDWETDVRLEQSTFPYGRQFPPAALLRHDASGLTETWIRSGRDSLSVNSQSYGMIYSGATRRQSMPRTRIVQPGFRGWVAAQANSRGAIAEFSDAGRRVEVLRRLWGSRSDLVSDWSTMRRAFRAFRSEEKKTVDAFPDGEGFLLRGTGHAYLTFTGISKAMEIGADTVKGRQLRDWTDKLVARRVLRRGVILGCKECAHVEFVALAELGDSNACSGCGAENQMTQERWSKSRSDPEPKWFYDLHQAARSLIGADGGVSLLAADYFARSSDEFDSVAEMDFFDQESGDRFAEIDLVAYAGGRLIVAEAKTVPTLGTRKERTKKITALTRTAKLLQADEILLCSARQDPWTPADLESLKKHVIHEFPEHRRRPRTFLLTGLADVEPAYEPI